MKKLFTLVLTASVCAMLFSCEKDFDETNKNPNGFTTASDGSLFNAAIASLKFGWNEQLYVNVSVLYKETQLGALPQVRWNNYTIGTEEIWRNYYTILPNFRELERRWSGYSSSSPEKRNMLAMEKILLAFKTFKMTDLFGDIPFSEAGYGYQDVNRLRPTFDSQASIYLSQLEALAWAARNIDPAAVAEEPIASFRAFDNLFFGDLSKWRKFANSLRLRYAMRMADRDSLAADSIVGDILNNDLPLLGAYSGGFLNDNPYTESAALYPYQLGFRNESKGWSYNQSKDMRMGTNVWQVVSRHDSTDGSGIFDPRAYYFFDTDYNNRWVPYPNVAPAGAQPDGGIPYEYQRDALYSLKGQTCNYSPFNYHLVRDMDFIPDILMTGAEVHFLRAEAFHRGIGVGAPDLNRRDDAFINGLLFSLNFWQTIMNTSKLPNSGATFASNVNVPSNLGFVTVQNGTDYFSLNESEKIAMIYTQSWLDLFLQPQEAWALVRRKGSYVPHEGPASTVYRLPIPPSEVSYNEGNWLSVFGSASGDAMDRKMWWMR
jgi:hypothetical protein